MRIWMIGTDPLARALGRSWAQAGHEVLFTFGDRTDWDALAAETGCRYGTLAEGAAAEVVLLAAPWSGVSKGLRMTGSLAGKVVLDATNPHEPMLGPRGPRRWPCGRRGRGWSRRSTRWPRRWSPRRPPRRGG